MFGNTTDDEDIFFAPVSSSNLASLFGVTPITQQNMPSNNITLTYTAPKQPTSKTDETQTKVPIKHQSTVLVFKEVYAFKLIEKNYINQGKCGFALIGNDTTHVYQLLLYKQKNDIISTAKLSNQLQFIIQKDNYSSFTDDQKNSWTIHFSSQVDLNEFSQVVESRGGKIIKNIVEKMQTKDTSTKLTQFEEIKKESSNQIDSDQSDASGSNAKASILTRMAKMGQKLLPNSVTSDGTDSDTDKDKLLHNKSRKSKRATSVAAISVPAISANDVTNVQSLMSRTTKSVPVPQPYAIMNGQYVPIIQSQLMPFNPDMVPVCNSVPVENVTPPIMYTSAPVPTQPQYDPFQIYFAENRTHNSEIRMNILRLTNKMEDVLDKVQKIEVNPSVESNAKILKEENEQLKLNINKLEKEIQRSKELERKRNIELVGKETPILEENVDLKNILAKHVEKENEYVCKIKELETKINMQSESINHYENLKMSQMENNVTKGKPENIDETIKRIMNTLYHDINDQIRDDDAVCGKDVKKILAQKIVDNTYSIIAIVSELNMSKSKENELE